MKKVSLQINDSAVKTVVGILTHLGHLSNKDQKRTIRIGGDEKVFDGSVDDVTNIQIDGAPVGAYKAVTPARNVKAAAHAAPATQPVASVATAATAQPASNGKVRGTRLSDSDLEDEIIDVIADHIAGEKLFTAYDITTAIRAKSIHCPHKVVRDHINEHHRSGEFSTSDYMRSLIFVKPNTQSFVYHPDEDDPNDYGSAITVAAPAASNTGSSVDPLDALD